MTHLGLGVMLNMLAGNAGTVEAYNASMGKEIVKLFVQDETELHFEFTDGTKLVALDDGQSCCESRYMTVEDDLSLYIGATLQSLDIKAGPEEEGEYGDAHEIEFLEVTTSKGQFQISNHNEHNGYYGGFAITLKTGLIAAAN